MAILFSNVSILSEDMEILEHKDVLVEGEVFSSIADHDDVYESNQKSKGTQVIDGSKKVLLPGFINTHSHAPMTIVRGVGEGLPLSDWLGKAIWPIEGKLDDDVAYWASLLANAEMLKFGCTSYSDMYFFTKARIKAAQEAGIKMNVCDGATMVFVDTDYDSLDVKKINDWLMTEVHGKGNGKIRADFCIHGEYTTPQSMIERVVQEAHKYNTGIHLHLSETKKEVEECKERHQGMSPVEYFNSLGVFDVSVTAAHCVWTDDNDLDILKSKDVSCAINPSSNMKLGSGFAPVARMLEKGINVCLGTDGVASNNALNMLRDAYLFALIYKGAALDPTVAGPNDVMRAMTINGARAQGRTDTGRIKEGFKADACLFNLDEVSMVPCTDVLTNIIYSSNGSEIKLTMVDGEIVYKDGSFTHIDIEKVKYELTVAFERITA